MPGNPRKRAISATQAEPDSALKQNRRLTQEIPADTAPQQKAGEKVGLEARGYSEPIHRRYPSPLTVEIRSWSVCSPSLRRRR